MVKIAGGLIFVAGVGIFAGNVTGMFPTFPGLGYLTIILGGWLYRKGE